MQISNALRTFLVFMVMLAGMAVLCIIIGNQRQELERLKGNQSALMDSVTYYRTESGRAAASVATLELTRRELERSCSELTDKVRDMGVRLRRAEEIGSTVTQSVTEVRTVVRDSIWLPSPEAIEPCRVFTWSDPWTRLDGLIRGDTLEAVIESRDTLTTVLHRERTCLFKPKVYRLDISCSNPHNEIVYEQFVRVTGRRRK